MPVNPPNTVHRTSHAMTIRASGLTVGSIQSWGATMTRQVSHVYEINQATSGEPIEAVPGNVGGLSISVGRYDLFSRRMEQAFGTPDFEMLGDQSNPFEVRETWRFPNNGIEGRSYIGCWFSSLGRTYTAGGDRLVQTQGTLVYVRKVRLQ